ncbi:MAG: rhodanese-like domain-containing protein [Candidatus Rifleibacteriota bacterium]
MSQIGSDKAKELIQQGAVLVDVRTPGEFAGGSIENAINLPLDDVANLASKHLPDRNQPILVFCLSGSRSAMAKTILSRAGYTNVHNLGSLMRARSIAG